MAPPPGQRDRKQTDDSLALEREKSDAAVRKNQAAVEKTADALVERARENADQVLDVARARADEKLAEAPCDRPPSEVLAEERAVEDQALSEERAKEDDVIRQERALNLARLFPFERDTTDLFLRSERVQADDALENRDEFLGMVAHDLRDLVNEVQLGATVLTQVGGGERVATTAKRIQRSTARMARLIGDLVDIVSIDAGKLSIEAVETDLAALVNEAIDVCSPPAAAKGVTLVAGPRAKKKGRVDPGRLLQVLTNLISNAIKFTPAGGTVTVSLVEDGESARYTVRDDGIGVPLDKLTLIFERHKQVGSSERRGLGLGLYISQCIVAAHGGRIWAESGEGGGTAVSFTVPTSA